MQILEGLLLAFMAFCGLSGEAKKNNYLGTETPYIFEKVQYTMPPSGYKPIYINHLGRHGARYLTSPEGLEQLYNTLEDAGSKGELKAAGVTLKSQIEELMQKEAGNYGLLTSSGAQMEEGIARRMYEHFPEVFGKEVVAVSTYVERTKQSMEAFLNELGRYTPSRNFKASSNGPVDPILRFFDLNTAYIDYKEHGEWKQTVKNYEKRLDCSEVVLSQFFKPAYLAQIENKNDLATELYKAYTNQFDIEKNVGLGAYFTQSQLKYYWENENLSNYLEKGPSYIGEDLPTNISFALLADFLETTEAALTQENISANLRFAHAETIIPFASLLKLGCCSKKTDDVSQVPCIWKDNEVAPMAANIQWIFYKHEETGDILIKMLYNEKEIELPLVSPIKPYYKWEDVKAFYTKVLQDLNINWDENIVELVKDYKVK